MTPVHKNTGSIILSAAALMILPLSQGWAKDPKPDQKRSALVRRGAYLVRTSACNDCHTPHRFDPQIGALVLDETRLLAGATEGKPDPASPLVAPDAAVFSAEFTSFRLPFGVVYAANLTPDETGLNGWTEKDFISTLRTGKHLGSGRALLPPMPWDVYGQMTDEDLRAIFAYLQSIPPIRNKVPYPKVPGEVIEAMWKTNEKISAGMKVERK